MLSVEDWAGIRRLHRADETHRDGGDGASASSVSDGNRDGNTGNRQRPEAVINSRLLSHVAT